jgi:hypothetical protein
MWALVQSIVAALALLGSGAVAMAQNSKPKVPPGIDPGGLGIAFITHGIDYTKPAVAAKLARDGEGEMIGYDFVDGTLRPWAAGNALDDALVALAPGRVIPFRVGEGRELITIQPAMAFLKSTGTRVVVLPRAMRTREDWEPFVLASREWPSILFLVAADDVRDVPGQRCDPAAFPPLHGVPPGALELPNVLVVASLKSASLPCLDATYAWSKPDVIIAPPAAVREAPGAAHAPPLNAAEAAILAAGLIPMHARDLRRAKSAAEAKRVLLSKAVRLTGLAVPVLECCDPL